MHQVGRRVRSRDRTAPLDVDLGVHHVADSDLTGGHPAPVHDQPGNWRLDVEDLDRRPGARAAARRSHDAHVCQLAAALGIARRSVEHDIDPGARTGRRHRHAACQQPDHGPVRRDFVVAGEHDLAGPLEELRED